MLIDVPKDVRRPVLDAARTREEKRMDKALSEIGNLQHLEGLKMFASGEWRDILHGTATVLLQRIEIRMAALRGSTPEANPTATPAPVAAEPAPRAPAAPAPTQAKPAAPSAPAKAAPAPATAQAKSAAPSAPTSAVPAKPPVAPAKVVAPATPAPEKKPEPPKAPPVAPTVPKGGGRGAMEPLPVSEPDEFKRWIDPESLQ